MKMQLMLSLSDVLIHPKSADETAFHRAFNTNLGVVEWVRRPENAATVAIFSSSMEASQSLAIPDAILEGEFLVVVGSDALIAVQASTGKV